MYHYHNSSKQRSNGAALIVGLVLLVVLSLLAIAGMNSAKLEFIMAGNEQFKQNAFQAAETGIEIALMNQNPEASGDTSKNAATGTGSIAGMVDTNYSINYKYAGAAEIGASAKPSSNGQNGGSNGGFIRQTFLIVSTGNSTRNSTVTNSQGVAEDVSKYPGFACDQTLKTGCNL